MKPFFLGMTALVVAVLTTLVVFAGRIESANPARATSPPIDLTAPVSGALKELVIEDAGKAAAELRLTPLQTTEFVARVSSMSPDQLASAAGLQSVVSDLQPADECLGSSASCGANLAVGLGGCVLGAAIGSFGGPIGAGLGCVAGAAVGILAFNFGIASANNQADAALNEFNNWSQAQVSMANNEWAEVETSYENLASALNFSEAGFQRMADNAALLQLGNSTFNLALDEAQSGLAAQFGTILQSYVGATLRPYQLVAQWSDAQLTGNGPFTSGYQAECPNCSDLSSTARFTGPNIGGAWVGEDANVYWNETVYIPPGTTYLVGIGSTNPIEIHPVLGKGWTSITSTEYNGISGLVNLSYSFVGGLYQISAPEGQVGFWVPGGSFPANGVGADISGWERSYQGSPVGFIGAVGSSLVNYGSVYGPSVILCVVEGDQCIHSGGTGATSNGAYTGAAGSNLPNWFGTLEYEAAQNGEADWQFLRSIGYTSESQVAPDCIVPAPWQVLPADLNLGELNESQLESLYLAWLNGEAKFYNTSLSGTSFCGTQATRQFTLNNTIWGNLLVNATGYVYLNNGTSPINVDGNALPSEQYGNHSTWALVKAQLLLMPTLHTVSIPVGMNWAIPSSDPMDVYAIQPGDYLTLVGNGTEDLSTATATAPGDSIFLTSCTVEGVPTASCTVTVQTIATTSANLTCLTNGTNSPGSCQPQGSPGGTFGGLPNPFTWLANAISGFFSALGLGSGLSSFLGSLFAGLIILIVVVVLIYVAVVEVEAWGGKKKRGGGASSGGATGDS
ncbi:MAG: hypothetical protein WA691_02870 [Thermoplasmata archaeon]